MMITAIGEKTSKLLDILDITTITMCNDNQKKIIVANT